MLCTSVWMEDIPQATEQLHQLPTLCTSVWTQDIPRVTKQRAPTRTLGIPCYACLFAKEDTPQVTEQPQELPTLFTFIWTQDIPWVIKHKATIRTSHTIHVYLDKRHSLGYKTQSNHKNFPCYARLFGHKTSLGLQNKEHPQEFWGSHAMRVCLQRKTPLRLQSNHKNFRHYSRLFGHNTSLGLLSFFLSFCVPP